MTPAKRQRPRRVKHPRCGDCQHYYKKHPNGKRCSAHYNGVPCGCDSYVNIGKKVYKTVGPRRAVGVIYSKTEIEKPPGYRRYGEEV